MDDSQNFYDSVQSDELEGLRSLFDSFNILSIADIFKFEIVIDTNVILGDLIWMHTKRKNPNARSILQELLAAQTLAAHAPCFLIDEVEKHIPKIAKEKNINELDLKNSWEEYAKTIEFHKVDINEDEIPGDVRDPKDLSYIKLQNKTGALIYSKDKDIEAMDGDTVDYRVFVKLRDYSRQAAVEYTIKVHGIMLLTVGSHTISAIIGLFGKMLRQIKKTPWPVLLVVTIALILVISKYKHLIKNFVVEVLPEKVGLLLMEVIEVVESQHERHEQAKLVADNHLSEIKKMVEVEND